MEIVKFKKGKKNIYEIELTNGSILKLYDDVIVKYNLLVNKKIDNKKLEEITDYNDSLGAYYNAINYISHKLRSEVEITKYLEKNFYSKEVIDKTINKIKKDGYLDRNLYIKSYINDDYNFTNNGPNKVKYSLIKLGFKEEEILPYLDKDYLTKAKRIIDKKVKTNTKLSNYMLKQKLTNYLVNLGYSKEMFIEYLNNININDKDTLIKEVNILIKKYSKKYENDKLMYFIKDKLYKKGYNMEVVGEVLNELL